MAFELRTARLVIRMLARGDLDEFVRYRNVPDVARFQDWPLPYPRESAERLVDEQTDELLDGPTPGTWVQLAVVAGEMIVGDLAVWLDEHGDTAMIGYTLAPEHQHQGLATEAVGALVTDLFTGAPGRPGVHRVAASLDPENKASAALLERLGFRHEGTARLAAFVRGEWADDARYALLADEWPTGSAD